MRLKIEATWVRVQLAVEINVTDKRSVQTEEKIQQEYESEFFQIIARCKWVSDFKIAL